MDLRGLEAETLSEQLRRNTVQVLPRLTAMIEV